MVHTPATEVEGSMSTSNSDPMIIAYQVYLPGGLSFNLLMFQGVTLISLVASYLPLQRMANVTPAWSLSTTANGKHTFLRVSRR